MKKSDCAGCYNDDYNHGLGGAKECWSFDAKKKLERRYIIPVDQPPPYKKHMIRKIPPCYTKQRFCCPPVESIGPDGYWVR